MKKFLAMLLLVAILASCTLAFAEKSIADATAVKFKTSAYVYKKAGSGKTDVIFKKGTVVGKIGTKGKWTKILYGKNFTTVGWVRSKYLTTAKAKVILDGSYFNVYHYASGGSGKSTEASVELSIAEQTVKTTGKVNLRKGASLSSKSIKTLKKGTKVKLLGPVKMDSRMIYFYKVKAGGEKGWVSGAYLPKKLASKVEAAGE